MTLPELLLHDFSTEFQFQTARSSGAGGQNVNKVETKVELRFDILASNILTDEQKEKCLEKLQSYIIQDSILQISSQEKRSQLQNKEVVIKKFYTLLKKALTQRKKRLKTVIPQHIKEEKLKSKKLDGEKKEMRKKVVW